MAAGELFFGLKAEPAVFGFAGSVISLRYVRNLTPVQAVIAVMIGLVVSVAFTPWVMSYPQVPTAAQNGVAFLFGLTAMNIVPFFVKLSDKFRRNPEGLLNRVLPGGGNESNTDVGEK